MNVSHLSVQREMHALFRNDMNACLYLLIHMFSSTEIFIFIVAFCSVFLFSCKSISNLRRKYCLNCVL